jgi:hypothetical protein
VPWWWALLEGKDNGQVRVTSQVTLTVVCTVTLTDRYALLGDRGIFFHSIASPAQNRQFTAFYDGSIGLLSAYFIIKAFKKMNDEVEATVRPFPTADLR